MNTRFLARWRPLMLFVLVAGALSLTACKEGPKQELLDARAALASNKPNLAEKKLKAVLKAEPKMFEAHRLMVEVESMRGHYAKADTDLTALWKKRGFDHPKKNLTTSDEQEKQLMQQQFHDLYAAWAKSINAKTNPAKFEKVVRKGLKREPKDLHLNTILVKFYQRQAEKQIEQGKKLAGAATLDKILQLRTTPQIRSDSSKRAHNLRLEVFTNNAKKHFQSYVRPRLVEAKQFDAANKAVIMDVTADVSRRLSPRRKADILKARAVALQSMQKLIRQLVIDITQVPATADFAPVQNARARITKQRFRRGHYDLSAEIPVSEVIRIGFAVHQKTQQDKKNAPAAAAKKAATPAKDDNKAAVAKHGKPAKAGTKKAAPKKRARKK